MLHEHAASTLEPAVLLHTDVPASAANALREGEVRVDVHSDGPGSATVTVRALVEDQSLAWQLPVAPLVAALPGQHGPDGRMVLLAVVDAEPEPSFWSEPVDCERLTAELLLPVSDLADALRGRLTPWLAEDVALLLHDDAHDHAADRSPEQTLASAVLSHYRAELDAEQATSRVVRGVEFGPEDFQAELGQQLAAALCTAVVVGGPAAVDAALTTTGPFEYEVLRLLEEVPAALAGAVPDGAVHGGAVADGPLRTARVLLAGPDRDETVGAAVSVTARLARAAFGSDVDDAGVLRRLGMVDDDALATLAEMWVAMAVASSEPSDGDTTAAAQLGARVADAGPPAAAWLHRTAQAVATAARAVAGRTVQRIARDLDTVRGQLDRLLPPGVGMTPAAAAELVQACLALARFARTRAGVGVGEWLAVPPPTAAAVVGVALADGVDPDTGVDLLVALLESDVAGSDLLDAMVCATAQVLSMLDPQDSREARTVQVAELLAAVSPGPSGARWLLTGCLREAHGHDPAAADLTPYLTGEPTTDLDRVATRTGPRGVLRAGLSVLDALAATLGSGTGIRREEALSHVLPAALTEHDLLRRPGRTVSPD